MSTEAVITAGVVGVAFALGVTVGYTGADSGTVVCTWVGAAIGLIVVYCIDKLGGDRV